MTISDVEKRTALPSTAIRYYESRGLIAVRRKENGYRDYDEDTVRILLKIRQLRELGVPLSDIILWRDGVVTRRELIMKRLQTIEDDGKKSRECRAACEALLRGERDAEMLFPEEAFCEEISEEAADVTCPLLLGVDIGTTTISAQVIALDSKNALQTYSFDHNARMTLEGYPDAFCADAERLFERTKALILSILGRYPGIVSIGVTGQMHGIVCTDREGNILSPLYTWQNAFGEYRLDEGLTLTEEIERLTGERIPTGYGVATYYALCRLGLLPNGTAHAMTVMDLFCARLCESAPVMHATNAASMGAFDMKACRFKREVLDKLGIPEGVFPEVREGYALAGAYCYQGRRIPVACAIGDNQAGVFGSLSDDSLVLVNVGTSAQVSKITDSAKPHGSAELRPYFDGRYLLSGAILCGGAAYAMVKNFIYSAVTGLGFSVSDSMIYSYLNRMALEGDGSLRVTTTFSGTREDPTKRGSIHNISLNTFTPQALSCGVLHGIADELYRTFSTMSEAKKKIGVVASGNAVRKNEALCREIQKAFGGELYLPRYTEEASYGAALYGGIASGLLTREECYRAIRYQ